MSADLRPGDAHRRHVPKLTSRALTNVPDRNTCMPLVMARLGPAMLRVVQDLRPRQDSNLRTWLRRPLLYPLSYEGCAS
jgi:hypothetical protein